MLDDEGLEWNEHTAQELFEDTSAVEGRVESLLAAHVTEPRLARHCQAFAINEVPEIWEDDAACASFAGSFFDSLAYMWSTRRRDGRPKLILESSAPFLESVVLSHDPADEIRTALEDALGEDALGTAGLVRGQSRLGVCRI